MGKIVSIGNTKSVLTAIAADDKAALRRVYEQYREEFQHFALRYGAAPDDIADVYQDAVIAFYENIKAGKVVELKSSIKTYLFSIGKFMLFRKLKKQNRTVSLETDQLPELGYDAVDEALNLTARQSLMREALDQLGAKCRQLLLLLYYRRYATEAVMAEMDYSNLNVVKSQKARCMKQLRDMLHSPAYRQQL